MERQDTGLLLNPTNIKLHREYFKQMCSLIGINAIYRAPRENKHYNNEGELDTFFYEPKVVGCIFDEFPNQWTMKKLGWVTEMDEGTSLISVPYDLEKLQAGSIFIIPSGLDHAEGRLFRVLKMSNIAIYPASITCEIAPLWKNDFEKSQHNHTDNDFSLLVDEEDD